MVGKLIENIFSESDDISDIVVDECDGVLSIRLTSIIHRKGAILDPTIPDVGDDIMINFDFNTSTVKVIVNGWAEREFKIKRRMENLGLQSFACFCTEKGVYRIGSIPHLFCSYKCMKDYLENLFKKLMKHDDLIQSFEVYPENKSVVLFKKKNIDDISWSYRIELGEDDISSVYNILL